MILTLALNPTIERKYYIDNFQKNRLHFPQESTCYLGGKGVNIAKTLSSYDESVYLTGFIGENYNRFIENELDIPSIHHKFIYVKGHMSNSITIISNDGSETKIIEKGPSISERDLIKFYEIVKDSLVKADITIASDDFLTLLPRDTFKHLILAGKEKDTKFFLDISKEYLKSAIKAGPFLIKAGLNDLEYYIGFRLISERDIIRSAEYILGDNVEILVVPYGESTILVFHEDILYKISCSDPQNELFLAGLALGVRREYDFDTLLTFATALATGENKDDIIISKSKVRF